MTEETGGILARIWEFIVRAATEAGSLFSHATADEPVGLFVIALGVALAGGGIGYLMSRGRARPPPPPLQLPPAAIDEEQAVRPALENFRRILEGKGFTGSDLNGRVKQFAGQFDEMRRELDGITAARPEIATLLEEAREALETGEFARTLEVLREVGKKEMTAGRGMEDTAAKRLVNAAAAHGLAGDLAMAQTAHKEAAQLYLDAAGSLPAVARDRLAEYLNKHGSAAYSAGDHDAARESFSRVLELLRESLGDDHADVATSINNIALIEYSQGNYSAAGTLYRQALAIDEKALGPDHPDVATDLNNLALLYKKQGKLDTAEPLFKRSLAIKEAVLEPGHPSLVTGMRNYAALLRAIVEQRQAAVSKAGAGNVVRRAVKPARPRTPSVPSH